jgi:hypothetical protein
MKVILTAVFSLLPLIAFCEDDRVDRIVSYLRGTWNADFSVVSPDIRDEVIARLRKIAGGTKQEINGAAYDEYRVLIRIGEEQTMKQIVETTRSRWLTGKGWAFQEVLAQTAQPAVIPLIADDFFRNDGNGIVSVEDGDIVGKKRPFSIEMCRVAFSVLGASEAFAPETREWANESLQRADYVSPPLTRRVVQQWWRENEDRFRVRDYQAVTAGQSLSVPPKTPGDAESSPPTPNATPAVKSAPEPTAPVPVVTASNRSTPSSAFLLTGAGVSSALLVFLLVFWKRRV